MIRYHTIVRSLYGRFVGHFFVSVGDGGWFTLDSQAILSECVLSMDLFSAYLASRRGPTITIYITPASFQLVYTVARGQ